MPFLTNDPLPQCLQTSSDIALSPPIGNRRGCGRYLLEVKCLLERYHHKLFEQMIPVSEALNQAQMAQKDIFSFDPAAPGALAYRALADKLSAHSSYAQEKSA